MPAENAYYTKYRISLTEIRGRISIAILVLGSSRQAGKFPLFSVAQLPLPALAG
jgi:hypothetical protein